MTKSNTVILTKRWQHHTPSGGYDRLVKDINAKTIHVADGLRRFPDSDFTKRIWKKFFPGYRLLNDYRLADLIAELYTMYFLRQEKFNVVHALYGEDQLNLLLTYRKRLKSALVASYHLPIESDFLQKVFKTNFYQRLSVLDAAIVMSNSMITEYEYWVGQGKVFYVPHGIDTEIFHPKQSEIIRRNEPLKILTVGDHGRDWVTLRTVIEYFKHDNRVQFRAVTTNKVQKLFKDIPKIDIVSSLSEAELIHEYRCTDVVLLPVIFATANNSLLEALACGTPVISTSIGGIPDYLDGSSGWLLPPGDSRSVITLVKSMIEKKEIIIAKREKARLKALQYDWKIIAKETKKVYQYAYNQYQLKLDRNI